MHWIAGFTLACAAIAFLVPPMPQPLDYHDFADVRVVFGVPNFFDVVSNVAFLVAAAAGGIVCARRSAAFEHTAERWPYALFFTGLLLAAGGSAYYHLDPDNERLFWDRLPMTSAFMGLVAAQVVERIDRRFGLVLLAPMLLVGASSVVYWRMTERAGEGNVMPYAVLQGYAVVILVLIALLQPSRYTRGRDIFWVLGWYVLAKLFELFDRAILDVTNVVSGHTLKHLAAGVAGLIVCRMLWLRVPLHIGTPRSEATAAPVRSEG